MTLYINFVQIQMQEEFQEEKKNQISTLAVKSVCKINTYACHKQSNVLIYFWVLSIVY